jgi:hypothetical protein
LHQHAFKVNQQLQAEKVIDMISKIIWILTMQLKNYGTQLKIMAHQIKYNLKYKIINYPKLKRVVALLMTYLVHQVKRGC